MNGSNYLGFEEDDTEMGPHQSWELPAIYKCLNLTCANLNNEYLALTEDAQKCLSCGSTGSRLRRFLGRKPQRYVCGMCKCEMILSESEWPVGHSEWGFIKLSNRHPFQYICIKCGDKLKADYPSLTQEVVKIKDEVLPKIVRPSQLQNE